MPVVAVALNRVSDPPTGLPVPLASSSSPVIEYLSRWRVAQALNVFIRSMEVSGRLLTELRMEMDKPDCVIRPNMAGIGMLDEVNVDELARLGELAAEDALPELVRLTGWRSRFSRVFKR